MDVTQLYRLVNCPIFSDCPFTKDGHCTVYGYDLSNEKMMRLRHCPEYEWRYAKTTIVNERKMSVKRWWIAVYGKE